MKPIKELLANSSRGILFPESTICQIAPQLQELSQKNGMEAFIELISILHVLSLSENQKLLCPAAINNSAFANSLLTMEFDDGKIFRKRTYSR